MAAGQIPKICRCIWFQDDVPLANGCPAEVWLYPWMDDGAGASWRLREEPDVTPEEMEILKVLRGTDFQAFFPTGRSIAAAEAFDALVESLLRMQRSRWIELEVEPSNARVGYYRRKYKAAVARSTDTGREALKSASWVPATEETPPPKIP